MTDIDLQALRDFMATEVMHFTTHPKLPYSWIKDGNPVCDMDQWTPDLDSNQLDMLIGKMVEDRFQFRIDIYESHNTVSCWKLKPELNLVEERHPDRRLAVLLAIKAATEAK